MYTIFLPNQKIEVIEWKDFFSSITDNLDHNPFTTNYKWILELLTKNLSFVNSHILNNLDDKVTKKNEKWSKINENIVVRMCGSICFIEGLKHLKYSFS